MATVKITHEGQSFEIPVESLQLPQGYQVLAPGAAPDGFVKREFMQSELENAKRGLVNPASLLDDDGFFRRMAAKRSIELGEDGKVTAKLDPEKVKQLQSQWEAEHLQPKMKDIEGLTGEIDTLRRSDLRRSIIEAANEAGVKGEYLKPLFDGQAPMIVQQIEGRFKWDGERRQWFFPNAASGQAEWAENPTQERPFAGPDKLFRDLAKSHPDYFEDRRQRGSNFEQNGQQSRPGVASREDMAQGRVSLEDVAAGKVKIEG